MSARGLGSLIVGGAVALTAIFTLGGSFYTVDQGDRAVITNLGSVTGVSDPGFHVKMPFLASVHDITVRTVLVTWDKLPTYSRDQQPADLKLSIAWKIDPSQVQAVYEQYQDADSLATRVLYPRAVQALKVAFGQFNAATAISDRARLTSETTAGIMTAIAGTPIIIDSVQIENVDFSDAYENSVEQRMLAEVEVAKLHQNAEREIVQAQITVTQAQAKADSALAVAKAEALSITLRADAEAGAISKRGAALRDNPALVDLTKAEKWDGKLPTTMVPNSTVPFMDVHS